MATLPKFQFYEIVRINSNNPELAEIQGETGAILGRSDEENGLYSYGVFIDRDEICWCVAEEDIESTGVVLQRADFYDDNRVIRVQVDEQGRGIIAD
jgi:hypothetical protein